MARCIRTSVPKNKGELTCSGAAKASARLEERWVAARAARDALARARVAACAAAAATRGADVDARVRATSAPLEGGC